MNYAVASKQIIKYFAQQWNNLTKVAYPDVGFKPPNTETWVRLTIQNFDGYQASMGSPGSNRFRRKGLVTIQIFQKEGTAGLDALNKADAAVNIFRGVENAGIQYYDVQIKEIGNDGAGWYQINVLAYFQYDHIA
ncbi:phage tail terminator-like protein [Dyadobacter sp. CY323]|uniref:phage tail terminator-like protein n=1 Tax=Dyadobacter sp. CY323 TaxID=2907302 RepID=UPI001F16EE95|nr:phage tail terminator-like protein [Dyadobacter sp. CY323]MCE6993055.1 DUF4128 domain-containing protein [Dyadobacter sp. CY323]